MLIETRLSNEPMSEWARLGASKNFIVPTDQVPHEMQKIS